MADEWVVVGVRWSSSIADIVVGAVIIGVVCVVLFVVSKLFVLYYIWVFGLFMGECLLLAGRGPVSADGGW